MFGDFLCIPADTLCLTRRDKKKEFNDFIYHPLIFSTRFFVVKNYILFFLLFLLYILLIFTDSLCCDFLMLRYDVMGMITVFYCKYYFCC